MLDSPSLKNNIVYDIIRMWSMNRFKYFALCFVHLLQSFPDVISRAIKPMHVWVDVLNCLQFLPLFLSLVNALSIKVCQLKYLPVADSEMIMHATKE